MSPSVFVCGMPARGRGQERARERQGVEAWRKGMCRESNVSWDARCHAGSYWNKACQQQHLFNFTCGVHVMTCPPAGSGIVRLFSSTVDYRQQNSTPCMQWHCEYSIKRCGLSMMHTETLSSISVSCWSKEILLLLIIRCACTRTVLELLQAP